MVSAGGSSSSSFESFTTGKPLFPATTTSSTGGYSIEATAGARIYHTPLTNQKAPQWTYSRLKGRVIFGRDDDISSQPQNINEAEKYWFRLVDDTGRTVWVFRIPAAFEYGADLPFFHVFKGRSRRYGLLFNDDQEAAYFLMKISAQFTDHTVSHKRARSIKSISMKGRANSTLRTQPIHTSSISSPAPNSFVHVSHIGVSKDGVFEASKNIDPSWKNLISNMHFKGSEPTTHDYSQSVNKIWREFDPKDTSESSAAASQPAGRLSRHASNATGSSPRNGVRCGGVPK